MSFNKMKSEQISNAVEASEIEIRRINAISQNAKTAWLTMLGVLVFALITILGVKDTFFFTGQQETTLPLLGVSVPIEYFFVAGSIFVTALYVYLHMHLELLWCALGRVGARHQTRALSEAIYPWLISEWALRFRDKRRKVDEDHRSALPRSLGFLGNLVSVSLLWLFGLFVLIMFWWWSFARQDLGLTLIIGTCLFLAIAVGQRSWRNAVEHLGEEKEREIGKGFSIGELFSVVLGLFIAGLSYKAIHIRPKGAELFNAQISPRPTDWMSYQDAREDFMATRDRDAKTRISTLYGIQLYRLTVAKPNSEWIKHRSAYLANIDAPNLDDRRFQNADMQYAFMARVSVRRSNFDGANLARAVFEGAVLKLATFRRTNLRAADFSLAQLPSVKLVETKLAGLKLIDAMLDGAVLQNVDLEQAGPKLKRASMRFARFLGPANGGKQLSLHKMDFLNTNVEGAAFRNVRLTERNLPGLLNFENTFWGRNG